MYNGFIKLTKTDYSIITINIEAIDCVEPLKDGCRIHTNLKCGVSFRVQESHEDIVAWIHNLTCGEGIYPR
jgi:hypothetical protein